MNTPRALLAASCCLALAACDNSSKPPKPLPSRPGGQVAGPKVAPTGATGTTGAAPSTSAPAGAAPKPAEPKPAEPKPAPAPAAPTGATGATGASGTTTPPAATTPPATQPPKPAAPPAEPEVLKHTETNSGLIMEDLRWGTGEEAKPHDTVTIHYRGTFAVNGKTFDSSYDRNEPATFPLDRLIKGWQEGIPGMKVGSRRRLIVPPDLGYGPKDVKQGNTVIPGGSMLVFDIELLGVKR